jgi:hypothetical protein
VSPRPPVLKLDGHQAYPRLIIGQDLLHLFLDFAGHGRSPHGQDVAPQPVPHHAAHNSFRDVAKSFALLTDIEKKAHGVLDSVLHNPLDIDDVEIAGENERLA